MKDKQCVKILEKFQKQVNNLLKKAQREGLVCGTPAPAATPARRHEEVDQSTTEAESGPATTAENEAEAATAQDTCNQDDQVNTIGVIRFKYVFVSCVVEEYLSTDLLIITSMGSGNIH